MTCQCSDRPPPAAESMPRRPPRWMRWAVQLLTLASQEGQRQRTEIARLRNQLAAVEFGYDASIQRIRRQADDDRDHYRETVATLLAWQSHYEGKSHDQITVCSGRPCWKSTIKTTRKPA